MLHPAERRRRRRGYLEDVAAVGIKAGPPTLRVEALSPHWTLTVSSLAPSSWNAWPGLWGFCARGEARCGRGPQSPGLQARFQRPSNRLTPALEIPDVAVPLPAPEPAP